MIRNRAQVPEPGQGRDSVGRNTITEMFLTRVAAHDLERQYRDLGYVVKWVGDVVAEPGC